MKNEQQNKNIKLMKSVDFFKPFADSELDDLLNICQVLKFVENEVIIKESRLDYQFYIILNGNVFITRDSLSNPMNHIAKLSRGDCFGEMALLLNEPRTASVVARKECYLFEINGKVEKLQLATQVKIFRQFSITLSKRLKLSNTR